MILNIYFQIAGLIIAVVCAYFCIIQKHLNFSAERQFLRLICGVILSIFLDILSVIAITDRTSVGDTWTGTICRIYLISIVLTVYFAFGFSTVDIIFKRRKLMNVLMLLPLVVETITALTFPIEIHESGRYTTGAAVLMTYIFAVFYMICSIVAISVYRNQVVRRKRTALYGWFGVWIIAGLTQFFNNELLIASFTMAMGCMYMYIKLQNPEYHLDLSFNIFNRRAFMTALEEGKRFNKHRAVIAFQIFNMNSVNEIFGNKTSRALMAEICDYAKELPQSTEFKIDDNMFALIVSDHERMEMIVEQLEKRFNTPWEVNGVPVNVKAGVVYLRDTHSIANTNEVEDILHFFLDKLKKNNQTYMEIDEEALLSRRRSFEVQHALDWALSNDGVEVFYQPIYGIREGRFVALEALVRIKDENGKLIMPGDFIEFAEKNGMILKLGEEIFRKVCQFIKLNKIGEYGLEYIEVNLSVVQCMQDDLATIFTDMMGEYQIPPHQINFEITETAAINTRESLENNMSAFLKYGNTFSLDDYGSGYSNLTYIVEMPLKIIKIDRSLTIAYDTSEKARVATEYTVEMVHKLGMEIVVEGIETEEQYMNFKKLGVEFIQGYYFSKPLPSDKVLGFVREWL